MKLYTLAELKKLVRSQNFKMAALRSPDGQKVATFNKYKKTSKDLDEQFKLFETRLKSGLYPDGIYYVLLAHNIVGSRNAHEFPIKHGNVTPEQIAETENKNIPLTPTIIEREPSVLSWDSALKMQGQISDLTNKVNLLELEKKSLIEKIAELEEEEDEALSEAQEAQPHPIVKTLADAMPTLTAMAERYFNIQEKKLDLEALKAQNQKPAPNTSTNGQSARKMVTVGSQEHLDYIEKLFNSEAADAETKFNNELDKLEKVNPELYNAVLERLGLNESEEETEDEQ